MPMLSLPLYYIAPQDQDKGLAMISKSTRSTKKYLRSTSAYIIFRGLRSHLEIIHLAHRVVSSAPKIAESKSALRTRSAYPLLEAISSFSEYLAPTSSSTFGINKGSREKLVHSAFLYNGTQTFLFDIDMTHRLAFLGQRIIGEDGIFRKERVKYDRRVMVTQKSSQGTILLGYQGVTYPT
ncbi:hypothetical protein ARMSODRAFT_975809 [Armillaria solidipes]|uniref:Uncharacterized protein n=1 Tax=Armillaria solidipes TaxID=1076256 RepID=A0A2H3BBZ9_9AGAR|nr:hypothetical protein ARMSODRAFT_975809 [Armillaria solidipes]